MDEQLKRLILIAYILNKIPKLEISIYYSKDVLSVILKQNNIAVEKYETNKLRLKSPLILKEELETLNNKLLEYKKMHEFNFRS